LLFAGPLLCLWVLNPVQEEWMAALCVLNPYRPRPSAEIVPSALGFGLAPDSFKQSLAWT